MAGAPGRERGEPAAAVAGAGLAGDGFVFHEAGDHDRGGVAAQGWAFEDRAGGAGQRFVASGAGGGAAELQAVVDQCAALAGAGAGDDQRFQRDGAQAIDGAGEVGGGDGEAVFFLGRFDGADDGGAGGVVDGDAVLLAGEAAVLDIGFGFEAGGVDRAFGVAGGAAVEEQIDEAEGAGGHAGLVGGGCEDQTKIDV